MVKEKQGNFGVIGPGAELMLFRMTGGRVCITGDVSEARDALEKFIEDGVAIILVSDDLYPAIAEIAESLQKEFLPVIAVLPGIDGMSENSDRNLYDSVRKAIGFDITEIINQ